MAKARKAVPCVDPACVLLANHDGSCAFYRVTRITDFWRVEVFRDHEPALTFDLTHEPDHEQIRAGAVFILDPGRFPGTLRKQLPELVGTVYPDVSTDQTP